MMQAEAHSIYYGDAEDKYLVTSTSLPRLCAYRMR